MGNKKKSKDTKFPEVVYMPEGQSEEEIPVTFVDIDELALRWGPTLVGVYRLEKNLRVKRTTEVEEV